MTTNENDQNPHLSPLMANILTANAKWSERVTNQVFANQDREIREWKERFLKLFDRISEDNIKADSLRIQQTLDHFAWHADQAARTLDLQ